MYYHDPLVISYDLSAYMGSSLSVPSILDLLKICLQTSARHDKQVREDNPDLPSPKTEKDAWVITQYQVNLDGLLQGGETLEVMTKVVDLNRFFVTRQFIMTHQGKQVLEVRIQFALLDLETRKMKQINLVGFDVEKKEAIRFKPFKNFEHPYEIYFPLQIQEKDIDENRHVNNLVYIKWALDGLSQILDDISGIVSISVKYGSEVLPHHQVGVSLIQENENKSIFQAKIRNQSEQKDACKIQIEMRNEYHANLKIRT